MTVAKPCVIAHEGAPDEKHVTYATAGRAQRDAAMTAAFGFRYHVHEYEQRTLYGWLREKLSRA